MTMSLLTTKLYLPRVRPLRSVLEVLSEAWERGDEGLQSVVPRPRLIERLNEGLRMGRKLTLISAPAGFGKTTLLREWIQYGVRSREYGIGGDTR